MTNQDKLKQLLMDIFLLAEEDFRWDLKQEEMPTWDSLGTVSLAVGVQETFGHHFTPAEAMSIHGIPDLVSLLERKGIKLNEAAATHHT